MRQIAFLAGLLLALAGGLAHAQDRTPTAGALDNPAVRAEVEDWLAHAAAFGLGAQDMTRLWQREDAPLLDARTDIFIEEATAFVSATQARADAIRRLAPRSDAAAILDGVTADVLDRLDALRAARGESPRSVTRVLGGLDRLVRERLAAFDGSEQLHADAGQPIRAALASR